MGITFRGYQERFNFAYIKHPQIFVSLKYLFNKTPLNKRSPLFQLQILYLDPILDPGYFSSGFK